MTETPGEYRGMWWGSELPLPSRGLPYPQAANPAATAQQDAERAAAQALLTQALAIDMAMLVDGASVPIVFGREVSGAGGVWVSPPCCAAGFQVDSSMNPDVNYACVLGDGEYPAISDADVWFGDQKLNTLTGYVFDQVYSELPGSIVLFNYFDNPAHAQSFPVNVGDRAGNYAGLTVIGVRAELTAGDAWNRQVHLFIRSGVQVTRYVDSTLGPSNNIADLVALLLTESTRVPAGMINAAAMAKAAAFTNGLGLTFDGIVASGGQLLEWLGDVLPGFMLSLSTDNGLGLIPLLPLTVGNAIDTGVITPAAVYTDNEIVDGSDRIAWVKPADRKYFRALVSWREQSATLPPIVRTTEVGFIDRATSGPFEKYDLSAYCTSEAHAIRFGRYVLAQRLYCGHTRELDLLPTVTPPAVGSIVRVITSRLPIGSDEVTTNYRYRVQEVRLTAAGGTSLSLVHFPVDPDGRSQVAADVVNVAEIEAQVPEGWASLPIDDAPADDPVIGGDWITAVGGKVTYDGKYKIHTLTATSGVFYITSVPQGQMLEYLLVSGGSHSGSTHYSNDHECRGGAGGGVVSGSFSPTVGAYSYSVGKAGTLVTTWMGSTVGWQFSPGPGGNTTIFGLTAGGGSFISGTPQSNTYGATYAGGAGQLDDIYGGRGGAGGPGADATATAGGQGGPGLTSSITGTALMYGAGGSSGRFAWSGISEIIPPARLPSVYGAGANGGSGSNGMPYAQPGVIIIRYQYKP